MTGFGKASRDMDGCAVSIKLSSVNHRYLDSSLRLPNEWSSLDPVLREALKKRLSRGKLTVTISRKRGPGTPQTVRFDEGMARQYVQASKELGEMLGNGETLPLSTLAQFNGIFYHEDDGEDLDQAKAVLLDILSEALNQLDTMRAAEGEALHEELTGRLDKLRERLGSIEERLPELNQIHEEKLRARIEELNDDAKVTEDRVALEVAIMAERGDVTEEVVRLKSHLDHAAALLESAEPVGRQLNFLAQELQREINTLGAKVRDTDVVRQILEMKSELEKLREQIQNIE
jgi:uncharacterized protein (TIGR00255 family)